MTNTQHTQQAPFALKTIARISFTGCSRSRPEIGERVDEAPQTFRTAAELDAALKKKAGTNELAQITAIGPDGDSIRLVAAFGDTQTDIGVDEDDALEVFRGTMMLDDANCGTAPGGFFLSRRALAAKTGLTQTDQASTPAAAP